MKPLLLPALLAFFAASCLSAADAPVPAPPTEVQFFDHTKTAEGFSKGSTMLANTAYRISTYRRVTPGVVEIHELDTDILYVVEGTPVDPKPSAPHEIRAPSVNGGTARQLTKGDLIIVPNGTPHWFKEVKGEFHYLGIKVTKQ
jgi:hypothetical protein